MAESKEASLNEGYYGPSILPQHRRGHPTTPRCLDPYSLICIAIKIITIIIIAIGVVVLVLWLVYQPDTLKVYVEKASLARFDLAANTTLRFNLTLEMSIRNPNKKYDIHYKSLEAGAFYGGTRFGHVSLPRFRQRRKSTTTISPSFQGQKQAVGAAASFKREEREGFFSISLKIYAKVRLKMIIVQSVEYTPEVDCFLRVPVPANATAVATGFSRTECNVESFS